MNSPSFRSAQLLGDRLWHRVAAHPKPPRDRCAVQPPSEPGLGVGRVGTVSGMLQAIAETVRHLQIGGVVVPPLCRGTMW